MGATYLGCEAIPFVLLEQELALEAPDFCISAFQLERVYMGREQARMVNVNH